MIALPIEQVGLLVQAGVGVTSGLLPMAMHGIYTDLQPLGFLTNSLLCPSWLQ